MNRRVGGPGLLTLILLGVLAFCGFLVVCCGAGFLLQMPAVLATGWVSYLGRVVPQVNPDPAAVATAAACLLGVVFGGHAFLRWLYAATGSGPEPRRWPWRRTLLLVGLVVLMFTSGIAVTGMVHQTGWLVLSPEPLLQGWGGIRVPAARSKSMNNLKQIGIAAHAMHDAIEYFPRTTFNPTGRPWHSWQTHLLPYAEQEPLYRQIDLSKPWNHPANAAPLGTSVGIFQHPSLPSELVNGYAVSHYAGNAPVVLSDTPRTMKSFPEGTSNVVYAGQAASNFRAWGDPLNARDLRLGDHPDGFGGQNGVTQFLFLDGTVRSYKVAEFAALAAGKVPE